MKSDSPAPAPKRAPSKLQLNVLDTLENYVFNTRWLLFPVNVGLVIATAFYLLRFVIDDYHMVIHALTADTEEVRVMLLGLVDTAMVANLMIMIIQGSHQIFIRRFHTEATDRPQWLDHIDSGILKVKVALSIAGITLIQILKDFVNIEQVNWETVVHRMIVHAMCLVSALVLAIIWRITHPTTDHGHAAHPAPAPGAAHGSEHEGSSSAGA